MAHQAERTAIVAPECRRVDGRQPGRDRLPERIVILDPRGHRRGVGNPGIPRCQRDIDVIAHVAQIGVERLGDGEVRRSRSHARRPAGAGQGHCDEQEAKHRDFRGHGFR